MSKRQRCECENCGRDVSGEAVYLHCVQCMEEMPDNVSPDEWSHFSLVRMPTGEVLVVCSRHDTVAVLRDDCTTR